MCYIKFSELIFRSYAKRKGFAGGRKKTKKVKDNKKTKDYTELTMDGDNDEPEVTEGEGEIEDYGKDFEPEVEDFAQKGKWFCYEVDCLVKAIFIILTEYQSCRSM